MLVLVPVVWWQLMLFGIGNLGSVCYSIGT